MTGTPEPKAYNLRSRGLEIEPADKAPPHKRQPVYRKDQGNRRTTSHEEYMALHKQFTDLMQAIATKKNKDYTGGTDDAFSNFTRVELMGIATTEQGFLTRMLDKMARVISYAREGKLEVEDESVQDTLVDLANYSGLLWAYLQVKKHTTPEDQHPKPNGETDNE